MTENKEIKGDQFSNIEETLSKTEMFIEKNQKTLTTIVMGIVGIVAIFLLVQKYYIQPKERSAQAAMFVAEQYFAKDSMALALNGDGNNEGFLGIIDSYSSTAAGNLANYYAGICYLNLGEYENAIDYLSSFEADDILVSSIKLGAIGDAYAEMTDMEKAADYYVSAANNNENNFTTPIYLNKAAKAYEAIGDKDEAIEIYETLMTEFPRTIEGREAEKNIARLKA